MEVNQQLVDETRARVRGYLNDIYPDFIEFEDSSYIVQQGSATISIIVRSWHQDDCAVEFTSQLVTGANVTPELMKWLLQKNVELHFGALGLLFDDTIVYSQTLPGNDLSRREFEATVLTVAAVADHYDNEIVAMAGGLTGNQANLAAAAELGA